MGEPKCVEGEGEEEVRGSSSNKGDCIEHQSLHSGFDKKDDLSSRSPSPSSRIKWLIQFLLGGGNQTIKGRQYQRKKIIAVSLVALAVAAFLKRRRHGRITASSSSDPLSSPGPSIINVIWPLGLLIEWWTGPEYKRNPQESTMSLLWSAAQAGMIQRALVSSESIFFQTKQQGQGSRDGKSLLQWNRALLPPNNEAIKTGILEALSNGGCTDISAIPESIWSKLTPALLTALPFVYLALLYKLMKNQFGGEDISSKTTNGTNKLWGNEEKDKTTFNDVAGLEPVIEDLQEVVSYLSNPTVYKNMGARPPKGVLLHGPPGSGKTLLARAVAGEAMCDSFTALSGSAFVEMYVGRGAARVRSLFSKARRDAIQGKKMKKARSWWSELLGLQSNDSSLQRPPCACVFIDELDAVAKARSSDSIHGNDEREQTLNQLLTEMDGFSTGGDGSRRNAGNREEDVTIIVIAASNRVDVIDVAVLRRFDRQIFVGYPNAEGRKAILLVHARKVQASHNIDWDQLASAEYTKNFSGADLRNLINEAALFAIREQSSVVEHSHMIYAARRIGQMKDRTSKVGSSPPVPLFFTSID